MAKAVSNVKRVRVQGDITLTLTPEEAILLVSLLEETGDESDAQSLSSSIFHALAAAGVPRSDGYIARDGNIEFDDNAMDGIREAMEEWD
jgi:hypothetical protein